MLLQQLTYEINDKIYLLQEPKKSASAVTLLQNQLYNTIKELKISQSLACEVSAKTRKLSNRFAPTVTLHAQNQLLNATKASKKSFLAVNSARNQR